jgi:hypothetical protein
MSRRYYAKGKKTYAKDQNFEQDQVGKEKERYLINISLMSLKTLKDYDILGWRGEFYFKCDGEKIREPSSCNEIKSLLPKPICLYGVNLKLYVLIKVSSFPLK